jgi:hypothetical protein
MNNMSTLKVSSASSSSCATVSAPLIGDVKFNEEYVLVRKDMTRDEKEKEKDRLQPVPMTRVSAAGGRFGECDARLVYDFSITPSTSSTFQTVVAIAPATDSTFTNHWKLLFSAMKIDSAEVQLDFHQYMSSVGHDTPISAAVWAYAPNTFLSTQYYADVSDWKTSKFIKWSQANPIVRYTVPGNWIQGWSDGAQATTLYPFYSKWAPTQQTSATLHCGFVHIASQSAFFDTSRAIVGRLILNMKFKGQL